MNKATALRGSIVIVASAWGLAAAAGTIGPVTNFTNDLTSGLTPAKTYTHLLDFIADGSPAVVNGVTFTAANTSGNVGAFGWSSTNLTGTITEGQGANSSAGGFSSSTTGITPQTEGAHRLLLDFYYNGAQNPAGQAETLTLTGLTPGTQYRFRTYFREWDVADVRSTVVGFDEDGSGLRTVTIDQDNPAGPNTNGAYYVSYTYTAGASGQLVTSYLENGNNPAASWHNYGVSNEVVPAPEPATLGVLGLGAAGLLAARRRRRR